MIINANALQIPLADSSVQCCVTSPPYYGLRDYGTPAQLGLEPTPDEYVANMVAVFREVCRVLRPDGCVWLNLGDSYANNPGNGRGGESVDGGLPHRSGVDKTRAGLKPKDLIGIPWRVAFALQADGWWLRSEIIWHKPNPMPESVTDRPTKSHEQMFLLTKSARYFYDADAVREKTGNEMNPADYANALEKFPGRSNDMKDFGGGKGKNIISATPPGGRNLRSVWTIATEQTAFAHFATFPRKLAETCIKAGSREGDIILDPFCGSGTTGLVAQFLGRRFVGLDLSLTYLHDIAYPRLANGAGALFMAASE